MTEYRWVGTHAREFTVPVNGGKDEPKKVWVEPGGFIELNEDDLKDDPLTKELVDNGMLMNVGEFTKQAKAADEKAAAAAKADSESKQPAGTGAVAANSTKAGDR